MKKALTAIAILLLAAVAVLAWRRLAAPLPADPGSLAAARPAPPAEPPAAGPTPTPAAPPAAEPAPAPPPPAPAQAAAAAAPTPAPAPRAKVRPQRQQPDPAATSAKLSDRPGASPAPRLSPSPPEPQRAAPAAPTSPPPSPAVAAVAALAPAVVRHAASAPSERLPGAIAGTLRDAGGTPLPGVSVLALSSDGEEASETLTDDEGFYLLAAVRPGRHLVFTGLGSPLAGRLPARAVEVGNGGVVRTELRELGAGSTVTVRTLRADGEPTRAQVVLVAGRVPYPLTLPALLAADAIFLPEAGSQSVVRRVPAGVYSLVLVPPGDVPPRAARLQVTVSGSGEQQVVVRLPTDLT